MKNKKVILILIITNIISIGIICSFITKDMNLVKGKQIIKEMTETEYESQVEELNKSHTDYATYIQTCKTAIATAITNEGVTTSNEDTLEKMADNISNIFTERTKLDTANAATENDIVKGKKAYVNGKLITGNIVDSSSFIIPALAASMGYPYSGCQPISSILINVENYNEIIIESASGDKVNAETAFYLDNYDIETDAVLERISYLSNSEAVNINNLKFNISNCSTLRISLYSSGTKGGYYRLNNIILKK